MFVWIDLRCQTLQVWISALWLKVKMKTSQLIEMNHIFQVSTMKSSLLSLMKYHKKNIVRLENRCRVRLGKELTLQLARKAVNIAIWWIPNKTKALRNKLRKILTIWNSPVALYIRIKMKLILTILLFQVRFNTKRTKKYTIQLN